jgi:predicted metal-dependent phosphoesterase TrpH
MKVDLHFHTTASDGTEPAEVMVSLVKKRGLDGFSVTDHDTPGDIPKYRELARKYDLIYVSGMEITTDKGHVLAYCLPDEAEVFREFKPFNSLQYYVEKAKEHNVIIAPAHPFDYFRHGMGNHLFAYTWDAVETYNGSTVFPFANRRAHKAAQTLGVPEIGGTDAHTQYYVGLAYTEADASTAEELLTAIRKGKTVVGGIHITPVQFSRRIFRSKIKQVDKPR